MTKGIAGIGSTAGRVAVGHPIDVASGEFFTTDIDHSLPGVVPLSFGRTYSTRLVERPVLESIGAPKERWLPFGPGWRPSWLAELRATMCGFVYTRADGVEFSIEDPPGEKSLARTGRIYSPSDGLELRQVDDTHVRIVGYGRDRNPFSFVFERWSGTRYRLAAIERTREARIEIVYDPSGRPSHLVQRRERRSYELVHESDRVVRAILHLPDRTTRIAAQYIYDSRGRLVAVHDSRGLAAVYAYDDDDRIVHDEKRGGSVYTVRYGRDGRCEYAAGTNRYQERALRYDTQGRRTWVTDSRGQVTLYEWNERGQVIRTTTPCGIVTRADFDDWGRPIRETGPNGELRELVYDELGRLARSRRYGGTEATFQFDGEHRVVAFEESFEGEVVTRGRFSHDEDHNVTSAQLNEQPAWTYAWSSSAEVLRITAPSGASTHRYYDDLGALRRATSWDQQVWSWTRDALGRTLTEVDPLGHTRQIEYLDEDGQSLRVVEPDGRVYERVLSQDGRTLLQRLPGNRTRAVEFSFCGQLLTLQDEEGAVTRLSWGTEPGELLAITNANHFHYTFAYDADMRIVERRTFDGRVLRTEWDRDRVGATYDGMGRRTAYEYDLRGLITKETSEDGETRFEYDKRGLLERVMTASATLRLSRDAAGRVIAEEQDGVSIERTLDVMGRPLAHRTPFGSEATFVWSPGGALEKLRYGTTEVGFERDGVGRETKRHLGDAGVFEQAYDSIGRLVAQAFHPGASANGPAQVHAEDADAAAAGVIRHFGFDERGFLSSIEDSLRGATRLIHSDRGDLTGVVRQSGWSDFYLYDSCHNRVYHAATEQGAALAAAVDRASRERSAMGDVQVDALAARFPHDEQTFGYLPGDRVVLLGRTDGRTELIYDANGQVTSKTIVRGNERTTWKYSWNARGELTELTTPNGKVWRYRYDGAGRRLEKMSPTGDTWRYVWMGAVLLHTLKNGAIAETYVHEPGGTCPILRDDGAIHFILPDQNDAPSEEVSANGKIEWVAQKGTWGEGFSPVGAAGGEPFLGQWYDSESGLHYNYFRYYDPEIGRYLSPDPIDLLGGLNAYLSVSAPFTRYDRLGLSDDGCKTTKKADPPQAPDDEGDANYELYTDANNNPRIRFKASEAVTAREATAGRNYSLDNFASLTPDGKVFVGEGRHRAIGAARGDAIPVDIGGVAGRPGWLDYNFEPAPAPTGGIPVSKLTIDYNDPDVGADGAKAMRKARYGDI